MSLQATTWALYDATRDLDANEFRLLMVMADMADQNGRNIYPSAATLADLCGVTTRTIRTKLASLEAKGLIIRDDQSILAHIPANRRPVAWRLNMDGGTPTTAPATVAEATPPRGENIAPQTTAADTTNLGVKPNGKPAPEVKSGVKPDRKSGVKHAFTQTHSKGRTVEPREAARTREAEPKPQPAAGTEAALAVWQPNAEARALTATAHADLVAEAEKFRCRQLADGHIAKNLDAAFTLWLRRGIEGGYLTPATHERPSDTRHTTAPTAHRHTWDCAHVKAIMQPHEAEYDHTSTGFGNTSAWALACAAQAERLNQAEGITETALADGGDA